MTIARIEGGAVAETRNMSLEAVPAHKRADWRPIIGERPIHDPETQYLTGPVLVIEADAVRREWAVHSRQLTQDDYAAAIQAHIDETARSRGYADAVALASYVNSTIPSWKSEANTFVMWRDEVWLAAYGVLGQVRAGKSQPPTIPGLIAELPGVTWPQI